MNIPSRLKTVSIVEYASMSEDTYRKKAQPLHHTLQECGWTCVEEWSSWGFMARLYGRERDQTTVLAFRGTDNLPNIIQSGRVLLGLKSSYFPYAEETYRSAVALTKRSNGKYLPPIAVTGHSLGGCLAQYTAIVTNRSAKTNDAHNAKLYAIAFNPLHVTEPLNHKDLDWVFLNFIYPYILNYSNQNDIVPKFGKSSGIEHYFTGNSECSFESTLKRTYKHVQNPFGWTRPRVIVSKFVDDFWKCVQEEHNMWNLLQKIWWMFHDPHGEGCIPLRPSQVEYHQDHEIDLKNTRTPPALSTEEQKQKLAHAEREAKYILVQKKAKRDALLN